MDLRYLTMADLLKDLGYFDYDSGLISDMGVGYYSIDSSNKYINNLQTTKAYQRSISIFVA